MRGQLLHPLTLLGKSSHVCSNDECEGVMATIKAHALKISSWVSRKINFQDPVAF